MAMYGEVLRYCHAFRKWVVWDGQRWKVDDVDHSRVLAHKMMTAFAMQALKANADEKVIKFAASCRRTARITNCLREAEPLLPITPAELDTHPFLLNFLNGTLDLRTGELRPHKRDHFISKLVYHKYNPQAQCPLFLRFLNRIMGCHPDASLGELERADRLVDYLQRALGCSMAGETIEKVVFFLYGAGDNGKTTLLSTFLHLLQEYAELLQVDTLMVRQESNNTQADLADLRGARFVMTSETEDGQRLAEGKLKRITQGMGKIKAVRKYENPIEFQETHKLFIDANHLPVVRGTDNAIWNRLHPVPFNITIPKEEQDKELQAKLLAEAEGILAWAAQGARRWYAEGLGNPPDVEKANKTWRAESDRLGRFLDDSCVVRENALVQARPLYSAYKKWAEEGGEWSESEKKFADRMKERGFLKTPRNTGRVYLGLELRVKGEGS